MLRQQADDNGLENYVATTECDIARLESLAAGSSQNDDCENEERTCWRTLSAGQVASPTPTLEERASRASLSRLKFDTENALFKEISAMSRQVYDSFDRHEQLLQVSFVNQRVYMIDSFSETEKLNYELLLEDLRNKSIIKDMEDIDIQLEVLDPRASLKDICEKKIAAIEATWLLKIAHASQDHMNKSNLARSMFRRTSDFYDDLNEMEYEHIKKKYARELSKQEILHKLRVNNEEQDSHLTARYNNTEISHQKQLQWLHFKNLKEIYVRMMKKEGGAMDNHLTMLDTLFRALHEVYAEVMALKVAGIRNWYAFRIESDEQLKVSLCILKERCYTLFQEYRKSERVLEMKELKELKSSQTTCEVVDPGQSRIIASETVFGLAMTRQKALHVLHNVYSECGIDVDDKEGLGALGDRTDMQHLANIRKRLRKKNLTELDFKKRVDEETTLRDEQEEVYLETQRLRELHLTRVAVQKYLALDRRLEEDTDRFLANEDKDICTLKDAQVAEINGVMATHDSDLKEMLMEEEELAKQTRRTDVSNRGADLKERQRDIMISAHVFHEMRNVLSSILCLGETLREDPAALEQIVREQTDICTYGLNTMSDMLDVAKIKAASYRPKDDVVDLASMMREVIRIQGQRARKGVRVVSRVITLETDGVLEVITERRLLRQLLVNLLSNSAKFTTHGTIVMYARAICGPFVGYFDAGNQAMNNAAPDRVVIGVADTGPGVSGAIHTMVNDATIASGSVTNGFIDTLSDVSSTSAKSLDVQDYTERSSGYGLYLSATVACTLGGSLKVISPVLPGTIGPDTPSHPGSPGSFFYTILPLQPVVVSPVDTSSSAASHVSGDNIPQLERRNSYTAPESQPIHVPTRRGSLPMSHISSLNDMSSASSTSATTGASPMWRFKPRGKLLLLVVDDQKLLRCVMFMILRKLCESCPELECEIYTANSAEEGVRKHALIGFDIITLDENYEHGAVEAIVAPLNAPPSSPQQPLIFRSCDTENKKKATLFRKDEKFDIRSGDGRLRGSQVGASLSNTPSRPIVISCTGCDTVSHPFVLLKPYSLERLIEVMELHVKEFIQRGHVSIVGDSIIKRDGLILYERT